MAKAKVEVTSRVDQVMAKLDRAVRRTDLLREIASFIRTRIYSNTKRGYYAGIRKNLAKFKPLSPFYVEYRRSLLKDKVAGATGRFTSKQKAKQKALKKFGDFFSPARSNLTLTGQMLDALDYEIDTSSGSVRVFVEASQRDDDGSGENLSNADVAKKVQSEGRPFLRIDETGIERIKAMVIADLRRRLKKR
jgi:phage gpG-like protein